MIFLTDVEGWRADPDDPASRISEATAAEVRERLPQVERRHAAEAGGLRATRSTRAWRNAHIVDGREPHSLLLELFTDEGIGTKLWP